MTPMKQMKGMEARICVSEVLLLVQNMESCIRFPGVLLTSARSYSPSLHCWVSQSTPKVHGVSEGRTVTPSHLALALTGSGLRPRALFSPYPGLSSSPPTQYPRVKPPPGTSGCIFVALLIFSHTQHSSPSMCTSRGDTPTSECTF